MLVLCTFQAEGVLHWRDGRMGKFSNAIMIDVRSDRHVRAEFNREMARRAHTWSPIRPERWELVSYLTENGKPNFGAGVESHLRVAPPMAEYTQESPMPGQAMIQCASNQDSSLNVDPS